MDGSISRMIGWNEVIPMIELKVEEYCHSCTYFEAVSDMDIFYDGEERVPGREVIAVLVAKQATSITAVFAKMDILDLVPKLLRNTKSALTTTT